ncbi:2-C-methyl-D-erythritol 4-phosphate cytidylyltransferase [SAR202 cluster bacterium AD-802-E10_MRT_200m]|nr:2-C-methyl-D-erythritol 4-phosphate cytidylyltransferase [SAR202 cluster bacterium AD-802-E10_MRT_200m]
MSDGSEWAKDKVGAIVVAAGSSQRMGGVDKLYVSIQGRPLFTFALETFVNSSIINQIVLVTAPSMLDVTRSVIQEIGYSDLVKVCPGGDRRQDSVRLGLQSVSNCTWVIVHDGARPCVDPGLIEMGLNAAQETGAAVPGIPLSDTVKLVDVKGRIKRTFDRNKLWSIQTPQIFRKELLEKAHNSIVDSVTDDATMIEKMGHVVKIFPGSRENIKITWPSDLIIIQSILKGEFEE